MVQAPHPQAEQQMAARYIDHCFLVQDMFMSDIAWA